MADINAKMLHRNDTSANWTSANPVLSKGEIGVEINTFKAKIGDGVTAWNSLSYAWLTAAEAGALGGGDMLESEYATNGETGYVDKSKTADKLKTARNIALTGDVTGSASFDGSANASIEATLPGTVASPGTYPKITFDSKGLVKSGAALSASDIPSITLSKISDAGTAAAKNTGTASGNVPLIGAGGKLDESILPDLAITSVTVTANQAAMLALSAQPGDVAVRTDVSKTFILKQTPASAPANWQELPVPPDAVISVNGQTGAVSLASTNLTDSASLLRTTDSLVLDGGDASGA